jgi:hypothetical protein
VLIVLRLGCSEGHRPGQLRVPQAVAKPVPQMEMGAPQEPGLGRDRFSGLWGLKSAHMRLQPVLLAD